MRLPEEPTSHSSKPFRGSVWEGDSKIAVALDIGATHSGVAYVLLENGVGVERTFQRVNQWPGQGASDCQSKIPSLVWYNSEKKAVSLGAEALTPDAERDAEDNGWLLAKHFKLHLHPNELKLEYGLELAELPAGVSLLQVYIDFLGYLLQNTQRHFEHHVLHGKALWAKHQSRIQFIIAHPNGWGVREQAFLRNAAIEAGLATSNTAHSNICFVTEAEASVHFCLYHTTIEKHLRSGTNFAVCDAGGSTVDTTVYSVDGTRPVLKLKESRGSACVQAGAIFIDSELEKHIRNTLTKVGLHEEDIKDYTQRGVTDFEKNAKRDFCDATQAKSIDIAGIRLSIPAADTSRGRMRLPGTLIKSCFDVCVDKVKVSVGHQIAGLSVSYIFIVGGFGDSPYLRHEFENQYGKQGCEILAANQSTTKAVADGAVIWFVASSVIGRAPRTSFGTEVTIRYDPSNVDHRGRNTFTGADWRNKVGGKWSQIAAKDVVIDTEAIIRKRFHQRYSTPHADLEDFNDSLFSYSGDGTPEWMRYKQGTLLPGFSNSCTISADLKNLSGNLQPVEGEEGTKFWYLKYDICIRFGGTELEAYLEWEEKGVKRTGPATIIPDQVIR